MVEELTHDPGPEDFRALARSSPWRFRTLHLTHRQTGYAATHRPGTVEAWLDRDRGQVRVRTDRAVETEKGVPYGRAVLRVGDEAGPDAPVDRDAGVTFRPDGLVASRPQGWHVEHGDPMWRDYRWTAMLDPVELADGAWTESEHEARLPEQPEAERPLGVEITEVEEVEHRGRRTWRAVCSPVLHRYEPRCGCCPLLDSVASRLAEYGPEDPTLASPRAELPTSYLVSLDVRTGIVVNITPLDGDAGSGLVNVIHAVDAGTLDARPSGDRAPHGDGVRGGR